MREVFTTEGGLPKKGFARWREAINDRFVPCDCTAPDQERFAGSIQAARIGDVTFTSCTMDAMRNEVSAATMRRHKGDVLMVTAVLAGRNMRRQDDREAVLGAGDFAVYDGRSSVFEVEPRTTALSMEVSRERFEAALGPARLFSTLAIDGALGGASLAVNFMRELVTVEARLDEATRTRMASIGQDLLIAALAERMAREPPVSIQGDVAVQRAKAYVASWLGNPSLDPSRVAAASGVSLRRLQELFNERGHSIADWIWERRLASAAAMLRDPAFLDRQIGGVAFACGFANQAHFSTRFKARFGLSPREFRAAAVAAAIQAGPAGVLRAAPPAGRRAARIGRAGLR